MTANFQQRHDLIVESQLGRSYGLQLAVVENLGTAASGGGYVDEFLRHATSERDKLGGDGPRLKRSDGLG